MKIQMIQSDFFQNIDSKEKAYWLGFLYADVFITSTQRALSLNLSIKDEDQINRFIKTINGDLTTKKYVFLNYVKFGIFLSLLVDTGAK